LRHASDDEKNPESVEQKIMEGAIELAGGRRRTDGLGKRVAPFGAEEFLERQWI
jgi:hypothetical protein